MTAQPLVQRIEYWEIGRLVEYARNPRKNDARSGSHVVPRSASLDSKSPYLRAANGEICDGSICEVKSARKLGITEIPVILCDEWTEAQVKAFRLLVNRSATWADFDEELLALELQETPGRRTSISASRDSTPGNSTSCWLFLTRRRPTKQPPLPHRRGIPGLPTSGCSARIACSAAMRPAQKAVARLLGDRKPRADGNRPSVRKLNWILNGAIEPGSTGTGPAEPSYMKKRTAGHKGDQDFGRYPGRTGPKRSSWLPSLEIRLRLARFQSSSARVWNGLERIGFPLSTSKLCGTRDAQFLLAPITGISMRALPVHAQKKKAHRGSAALAKNSTVWSSPESEIHHGQFRTRRKYDHPTQKPVDLMRRPDPEPPPNGASLFTIRSSGRVTNPGRCGVD